MWIFTKYGFYSTVCARQGDGRHNQPVDLNRIMVRARLRPHLEALKDRFPDLLDDCEITESPSTDYAFRIFVDKPVWTQVVAGLTEDLDYDKLQVGSGSVSGAGRGRLRAFAPRGLVGNVSVAEIVGLPGVSLQYKMATSGASVYRRLCR